jgi:hypothetical protein
MLFASRLRRLLWIVPLGIFLAALSGYVGAIILPQAIAVWVSLLFLKAITMQTGAFFVVLAGPALFGLRWCWPVACVVLPLATLFIGRGTAGASAMLVALGIAAGAAVAYAGVALGVDGLDPKDAPWFALAGAVTGAMSGCVFALALQRYGCDS